MAASGTTTVSIKLLIDTNKNKVLFAEAGKDFVDFLFNLLALPVGTVICLLKKENMVGSLGNLYESVESLGSTYMRPYLEKTCLLKPHNTSASSYSCGLPLLLGEDQMPGPKIFRCRNGDSFSNCRNYVTGDLTTSCPCCLHGMTRAADWVVKKQASLSKAGYVRGGVTYMVMDDLAVKPMSSSSSLNKVTSMEEVSVIEEKVVELNMAEGLKLLKESMLSEMDASDAGFFVPLASEHAFRTLGHHDLSGGDGNYAEKCVKLLKAMLAPQCATYMPRGYLFHSALHWIGPKRIWEVIWAQRNHKRIPDAIKIRIDSGPAGAALVTTSAAILKTMQSTDLYHSIDELKFSCTKIILEVDSAIRAAPRLHLDTIGLQQLMGPLHLMTQREVS